MIEALVPPPANKRLLSDRGVALVVYVLYLVGFATGITALVGVLVAYLYRKSASPVVATHLLFQIRTLWIGAVCFVLGCLLWYFIVGIFVLLWWGAWTLIRVVRGMLLLNDGRPIPNPKSFLFGGSEHLMNGTTAVDGESAARSMLIVLLILAAVLGVLIFGFDLVGPIRQGYLDGLVGR